MASRRSSPADALVLFDIDGTLIRRAGPHHRESLIDAVRHATGLATTTDGIPLHGMLDPDILTIMLRNVGASRRLIRGALPEILRRAQSLYVRRVPSLERKTCPGVRRVLSGLSRRGVPMGLVTGNLPRIGWKKVERAGLKRHFALAAFAGMHPTRTGLARIAVREAREMGLIRNGARISLIGDTPADVEAARANGLQSVAVATGLSSLEELAGATPDVLLPDLRSLRLKDLLP
jgi:phosphoglycolate phosphatase-like HAD superfamily hydrolase